MSPAHPQDFQLECWHAGERDPELASHIANCSQCQDLLRQLDDERVALLNKRAPEDFVRDLRRRSASVERGRGWREHAARTGLALSAAIAAGVALAIVPLGRSLRRAEDRLSQLLTPAVEAAETSDLVAKGAPSLAVIRDRAGKQTLASRRVTILPGDKLRVRFQVEKRQRVSAGILADDGSWVPFFDDEFAAGSHIPEVTLQVDEHPSSGRILLGAPDELERARQAGQTAHVQAVELVWGGSRDAM